VVGWVRHRRLGVFPQVSVVLRGAMALVGPRPETRAAVSAVDEEQVCRCFSVRPGITGPTQLAFIGEDELLQEFANPTQTYRHVLVPAKVAHGIEWLATRTLSGDLAVLPQTLVVLASRRARSRSRRQLEALLGDAGGIPWRGFLTSDGDSEIARGLARGQARARWSAGILRGPWLGACGLAW